MPRVWGVLRLLLQKVLLEVHALAAGLLPGKGGGLRAARMLFGSMGPSVGGGDFDRLSANGRGRGRAMGQPASLCSRDDVGNLPRVKSKALQAFRERSHRMGTRRSSLL